MIQIIPFLLSCLGYYLLLHLLCKGRKAALYPALWTSAICAAGFLAGMTGCMRLVYSFIYVFGVLLVPLCIGYFVRRRSQTTRLSLQAFLPFVVLCAGTIWLYVLLEGYFLYSYDDFTHWGKIARVISEQLRFPIESDQLSHASYPPGSALFIAYVSNALGASDRIWLLAQGIMLLSFWISLLLASRKIWIQIVLSVLIIPLMSYNTALRALHVDNLLAAAAFAGIVLCLNTNRHAAAELFALSLVLCVTVLIKSSGLFLAALIVLYAVFLYWKEKHAFSIKLLILLLPFVFQLVWNGYVDLHFTQGIKHQISLENYRAIANSKSGTDVLTILRIILPAMLNPYSNHALLCVPGYLCAGLWYGVLRQWNEKKYTFIFLAAFFVVYEIGVLLMYIFSMPMVEIMNQNGADYARYNGTITAVLLALLLYHIVQLPFAGFDRKKGFNMILSGGIVVAVTAGAWQLLSLQSAPIRDLSYQINKYQTAHAYAILGGELAQLPAKSHWIVLFDEEQQDVGYDKVISQYYLQSENILRSYDRQEALELRSREPWRYYIDLTTRSIHPPTETIGQQLYTRSASATLNNLLDSVGYKENSRYSVTADQDIPAYSWDTTGYCSVTAGDVICFEKISWYPSAENEGRGGIVCFTKDREYLFNIQSKAGEDISEWKPVYDADGKIIQITIPSSIGSSTGFVRFTCQDINNDSILLIQKNNE